MKKRLQEIATEANKNMVRGLEENPLDYLITQSIMPISDTDIEWVNRLLNKKNFAEEDANFSERFRGACGLFLKYGVVYTSALYILREGLKNLAN